MASQNYKWEYDDVSDFLDKHGFSLNRRISGSHEFWLKNDDVLVNVNRPHGGDKMYSKQAIKIMVGQSGYIFNHWLRFKNLDKKGKKNIECCSIEDTDDDNEEEYI